jgi:hypothetical protein
VEAALVDRAGARARLLHPFRSRDQSGCEALLTNQRQLRWDAEPTITHALTLTAIVELSRHVEL